MRPSGKRPAMFLQPGKENGRDDVVEGPRIRIFYPDGHTEWTPLKSDHSLFEFCMAPCWDSLFRTTMNDAMRRANKFDESVGFPKMEFLGEL